MLFFSAGRLAELQPQPNQNFLTAGLHSSWFQEQEHNKVIGLTMFESTAKDGVTPTFTWSYWSFLLDLLHIKSWINSIITTPGQLYICCVLNCLQIWCHVVFLVLTCCFFLFCNLLVFSHQIQKVCIICSFRKHTEVTLDSQLHNLDVNRMPSPRVGLLINLMDKFEFVVSDD